MNDLVIYERFDQLEKAASALQKSGYFKDVTSQAQAVVKVMAGAELGLPPFASMTGINIIQGKPTLGANVIATLVKNDPRYDYLINICNDTKCDLTWFENGKAVGESSFTIEEAQRAGLTNKDNWKKYPSDMLFARAISRGARRHAPGIFGGSPVYTPDELGADTDPEGYIEGDPVIVTVDPEPELDIEGIGWSSEIIQAVMETGVFQHEKHAVNALNKSQLLRDDDPELAIRWAKAYRTFRDLGNDSDTAASKTNEKLTEYLATHQPNPS